MSHPQRSLHDQFDLIQLRTLVAIADHGGFHRAAAQLHISQSTVSGHVRALEKRLGTDLVARDGRVTRFTAVGRALLDDARRLLDVHDEAYDRLQRTGTITTIGCTDHISDILLRPLLAAVRGRAHAGPVRIVMGRSPILARSFAAGELDLALVVEHPGAIGHRIAHLPLIWLASSYHDRVGPDEPVPVVVMTEPSMLRQRLLSALAEAGRAVEITAESDSFEGVVAAARAGLGAAVLPGLGPIPEGLVARPDLPEPECIDVDLLARPGTPDAVVHDVVAACTQALRPMTAPCGVPWL